jgi:hypothetical protein
VTSSPPVTYDVVHIGGLRVKELPISDAEMEEALKGDKYARRNICAAFRERFQEEANVDCGWIDFDYMQFDKAQDVPTDAKEGTS